MMNDTIATLFKDPKLNEEINKYCRHKHLDKDQTMISPGDEILFVPIVMKGAIRIMRQNEEGNEVFLYHIYPGQTCAMALNCCQAGRTSMIRAVTEDETDIIQVPVNLIDEWSKYPEWRSYINSTYGNRFAEMLSVIDLIAFSHMDKQLLHYLRERSKALNTKALYITHQEIADELHTHREAISRLLRTMEDKKLLKLGRNTIELT
jgi:CRP/FNR family transcriptional regulator